MAPDKITVVLGQDFFEPRNNDGYSPCRCAGLVRFFVDETVFAVGDSAAVNGNAIF